MAGAYGALLSFIIPQLLITGGILMLINWWSKNFITTWLKVRASRGGKLLVRVRSVKDWYFRTGAVDESFLIYTDRSAEKKQHRLAIKPNSIYQSWGVSAIDVDETKNTIFIYGNEVSGFDAVKYDQYLQRMASAPRKEETKKDNTLLYAVCVVGIIVLVAAYMILHKEDAISLAVHAINCSVEPAAGAL